MRHSRTHAAVHPETIASGTTINANSVERKLCHYITHRRPIRNFPNLRRNGLKVQSPTNENIGETQGVQHNCQQSEFDERAHAQELLQAIAQKIDCLPKPSLQKVIGLLNQAQALLPKS